MNLPAGTPRRIAFVNQPWAQVVPEAPGDSISIWTHEVSRRLAAREPLQVTAWSRQFAGAPHREHHEGVEHRRVRSWADRPLRALRLLDTAGLSSPARPVFASRLYYPQFGREVSRQVGATAGDAVHIHNFSQYVPMVRRRHPEALVALHMHCEWLALLDPAVIARRLAAADLVVTCSDYLTDQVRQRFPALAERCGTVPNGVDLHRFRPEPAQPARQGRRLLFVGMVSPHKGVHVLLDAFRLVAAEVPDVRLDVLGPQQVLTASMLGPVDHDPVTAAVVERMTPGYLASLRAQVPPSLADRVRFVGPVGYDDMAAHYRQADLVVLPSVCQEAFGLPAVEAMASGVPVVASRSGGLSQLVDDGRVGLLVERGDVRQLAAALIALLTDEERRRGMGRAGRAHVRATYTWEHSVRTLLELYASAAARRRSSEYLNRSAAASTG